MGALQNPPIHAIPPPPLYPIRLAKSPVKDVL